MTEITLPNNWQPRPYQMPLWKALEGGVKRAAVVWHRRGGKDQIGLNWAACAAMQRVGNYWHMLPQANQARKAVWTAITADGQRVIDQAFPQEIRKRTLDNEMFIEFVNGSTFQLVGSDNFNALVGSPPVGIVFSEYSIADPAAWDFIRPILAENGGWAIFLYTPRGRNHGQKLYDMARNNPNWFAEKLTIEDTKAISLEVIEEERKSGMDESMIQQEYYCSFESAIVGSYFGKEIVAAEAAGRITNVPYDQRFQVDTSWDLGMGDSTAIWFWQRIGMEIRLIDYYEASGEGLAHYAKVLKDKPYVYGRHIAPHDIMVRELGTGKSRREAAAQLGIKFVVAPKLSLDDGIQAIRGILPLCWFDEKKCANGIEALRMYRRQWDERLKTFHNSPIHDWSSHGVDSFRYGCVMPDIKPKGRNSKVPDYTPRFSSSPKPGSWTAL